MNASHGPFDPVPVRLVIGPCLQLRPTGAVDGVNVCGSTGLAPSGAKLATACAILVGAPTIEPAIVVSSPSASTLPSADSRFLLKSSNVSPPMTKIRPSGSLLLTWYFDTVI